MSISTQNDILLSITKIEPSDGKVEKACLQISQVLTLSKRQQMGYIVIKDIITWLEKVLVLNRSFIKIAMDAVKLLIKHQVTADILTHLFHPIKSLLQLCVDLVLIEVNPDNECIMTVIEILNLLINDELLNSSNESKCAKVTILETVADIILQINFSENIQSEISNYIFIPLLTLPILSKISMECLEYSEFHSGDLLGLIMAYMHFNIKVHVKHPKKLLVSHQSIYISLEETHEVKCQQSTGGKVSRTPKPRFNTKEQQSVQITDNFQQKLTLLTTDEQKPNFVSDLIIGDDYNSEDNVIIQCSKVRLAALALLQHLTKSFKNHIFYGYWHALFPHNASCKEGILYVVISDENVQCRIIALQIASQIIFGAKAFLKQAEVPKKSPTSYMPLCFSLGQMLQAMYKTLNHLLGTESSYSVLVNVLKCLSVLVQATPFHRMHCDIVAGFLPHIRKLLHHEDASIQFTALMVLELLISTPKITKEISDILGIPFQLDDLHENPMYLCSSFPLDSIQEEISEEYVDNCDEKQNSAVTNQIKRCDSWLLNIVLQKLQNHELPASIKIKSLQVLSSMSIHFSMLINSLEEIATSLHISIFDSSTDVNLCATRCLDNIAYNMSKYLLYNESNNHICQHFWINMLPLALKKLAENHQSTTFKISLIDFLSNIGVIVFNRLSNLVQVELLSFLYGIGGDTEEDTSVRAAAIRALAVYVLFPSLKQDLVFVEMTAELAILLVLDKSLHVRIKSLWSIGNISDALASNCELVRYGRISEKLLTRLIKVSLNACNDNDKVRCNSVRALGNFTRLISTSMLDDFNCRKLFQDVTQKLVYCVKASGSAKVKWNSCYAIGCIMQNNALFLATSQHENLIWIEAIFTTLCNVIVQHSNYKVRINATNAITHISERSFYAQYFKLCWCSLMNALEDTYDLNNFLEYNHRDYLQERLCIALCHIIRLASNDDLHEIGKEIEKRVDIIKEIWFRVLNRMSPENAAPLMTCPVLLKERLKLQSSLTEEQINSIYLLTNTFCS